MEYCDAWQTSINLAYKIWHKSILYWDAYKIWHKAWNFWKEFSKGSFEVLSVLQSKYFSQNFLVQLCWALKFTGCKICHRENRGTFQRDSSVKRFFVSSQPQQHIRILLMFVAKNLVIFSPKYLKNVERGRNDHHAPILDLILRKLEKVLSLIIQLTVSHQPPHKIKLFKLLIYKYIQKRQWVII